MSKDIEPTECGIFTITRATAKAFLVEDADEEAYWIPRAQMDSDGGIDQDSDIGDEGELIIPEWLAVEKGLV